jgi:drug/metabolite transporter (DMT)-like permease
MSEKLKAHSSLLLANILFAFNYILSKDLMPVYFSPIALTISRIIGASILFWIAGIFVKEKIERKDIPRIIASGIAGVTINQFIFLLGLNYTSPIDASIIVTVNPVLILLIGAFVLKEKITSMRIVGIVLGAAGALLIIVLGGIEKIGTGHWLGNLLIFFNCVFYAIYLILAKPLMDKYGAVTLMKWVFLVGLIGMLPFAGHDFFKLQWNLMPFDILAKVGYVIVGATFLAYLVNMYGLRFVKPLTVSIYVYTVPVLTALIAIFSGKDKFSWVDFLAAVFVFTGVFLVSIEPKK